MLIDISNGEQLNKKIEQATSKAVKETAKIAQQKLQEIIKGYYDEYEPKKYQRTYQFKESSTIWNLSDFEALVGVDISNMIYKEISGYKVVEMAAEGIHGNKSIQGDSRFWEEFLVWGNNNLYSIFKGQLNLALK